MQKTVTRYERAAACGERIRKHRKQKGWSLKYLAAMSGFGFAYLANIEKGYINIPIETLMTIADALGVCTTSLLIDGGHEESRRADIPEWARIRLIHTKHQLAALSQDLDELLVHG